MLIKLKNEEYNVQLTSAQAFGRTKRPIRLASLALRIFSKSGTIVVFKLKYNAVKVSNEYTREVF